MLARSIALGVLSVAFFWGSSPLSDRCEDSAAWAQEGHRVTAAELERFRAGRSGEPTPAAAKKKVSPKLVVVLVVDQLRESLLRRLETNFGKGGFARLRRSGAVLSGHHGHQNTYTGPGHAVIATGSYGYLNGIVQNKWFNRQTGKSESMLYDSRSAYLSGTTDLDSETSPRNLIGTTLGDELRLASGGQSKVVALAVKERGAILLGGHLGQTYFYDEETGRWTTSTYYMRELPDWAKRFNSQSWMDRWFGKKWDRFLPAAAYHFQDNFPFEGDGEGLGRVFPHPLKGKKLSKPGPTFYKSMTFTPMSTEYTFAFARAALDGEALGQRGVTDLLAVSISATDLAGHTYGDYSQEYEDILYHLDRALSSFLSDLDRRLGPKEYILLLSSDHGAVPIPELMSRQKIDAARIKKAVIKKTINESLSERFGKGEWVVALEDPSVYLNQSLISERKVGVETAERLAGEAALKIPGMMGFYTRTQLLNGWLPPVKASKAIARSYFPSRSGDVVLLTRPFYYWGKYGEKDVGSTHGSFYRYDTDVPVFFLGTAFRPGYHGMVEMVDLAPTLARVLGLTPPAAAEGREIERILK
jgi:predicted AlkP superfamily pyrophosphatase or phosphodiesterase